MIEGMSTRQMVSTITILAAGASVAGAAIGLAIGLLTDLYRPAAGVSLGLGQGAAFGAVLGVALIGLRLWRPTPPQFPAEPVPANTIARLVYTLFITLVLIFGVLVGTGNILREYILSQPLQLAKHHADAVQAALDADPRFADIYVGFGRRGLMLQGQVADGQALVDLVTAVEATQPPTGLVLEVTLLQNSPATREATPRP